MSTKQSIINFVKVDFMAESLLYWTALDLQVYLISLGSIVFIFWKV